MFRVTPVLTPDALAGGGEATSSSLSLARRARNLSLEGLVTCCLGRGGRSHSRERSRLRLSVQMNDEKRSHLGAAIGVGGASGGAAEDGVCWGTRYLSGLPQLVWQSLSADVLGSTLAGCRRLTCGGVQQGGVKQLAGKKPVAGSAGRSAPHRTINSTPSTRNPQLQTRNPKPETLNPEP